jgi:cell fate regulator YaaT (PSP1 superfamily)
MIDTTTENTQNNPEEQDDSPKDSQDQQTITNYRVQFREDTQIFSADARIPNLKAGEVAMIQTDHGLEPAKVLGFGPSLSSSPDAKGVAASFTLVRRSTRDEVEKYSNLVVREKKAYEVCQTHIEMHKLSMKLIKVERYFNGSKIIFYFTAENRIDFRELVKDLVQEFRTRVEIRQIGVRHETKMIGGLGSCGRELCCCTYITKFAPVSIKMAKEQHLPLNPSKISGICNRLLCCLTYEYDTYNTIRKSMPKIGKNIILDDHTYRVLQHDVLQESIVVVDAENPDHRITLKRNDWDKARPVRTREKSSDSDPATGKKQKEPPQKIEND